MHAVLHAVAVAASILSPTTTSQDPAFATTVRCDLLKQINFSVLPEAPTQITSAEVVNGSGNLSTYCSVEGYISPQVGFEMWLPQTGWNGKLIQMGSGGHGGSIWADSCASSLQRGYACVASDMGHRGTGIDGDWARDNLQGKLDWGYRSTHVVTIAAKAIILKYYSREATHSYFSGCSTGGRQALQEAQRFPWDYDGIIAGAPPIRLADLYVTFAWSALANRDAAGKMVLTRGDLDLLTKAALVKCDMDDGLADGIISRPLSCPFEPSEVACTGLKQSNCLSPAKITAARRIYSGPTNSAGGLLFVGGALPGSESGWARYYLDDKQGGRPYIFELANNGIRNLFFYPEMESDWTIEKFRFNEDYKRIDEMQALYDSSNPDLTRFKEAGGKLIIYMGMNDISMPRTVIDYYQKVERLMGGEHPTQDFARLFLLPGVDHCTSGVGADTVDYLTYLDDWIKRGKAPDRLMGYHLKSGDNSGAITFPLLVETVEFSRPVYPYPIYARYKGHGDPKDAASFEPVVDEDVRHQQ